MVAADQCRAAPPLVAKSPMTSAQTPVAGAQGRRLRQRLTWCRSLLGLRVPCRSAWRQFGPGLPMVRGVRAWWRFRRAFRSMPGGRRFNADVFYWEPCLRDRTESTPVDPVFFVQDTWFSARIAGVKPARHVDIGSSAKTMALVPQFIPVTMVDIRPVPLRVPNFTFVAGSILALPFADRSIPSLSSICVIKHIGLGRYGDDLDPDGSEKAAAELRRVLASGGDLYVSVPIDDECRLHFNAHRAFTRSSVLELFADLELVAEPYLYGHEVVPEYAAARGFGTGMFHFRKL